MEQKPSALKALRIVYFALLTGLIMFAAISFFVSRLSDAPIQEKQMQSSFLIISLSLSFICIVASGNLFKRDLSQIKNMQPLTDKFEKYRASAIRTYALIEGSALFAVICFFLTHNVKTLIVVALLVVVFLTFMPSSAKIASQIGENSEDIEKL